MFFFFGICSNGIFGFDVFSSLKCLVSLMENMELVPGPNTSSLTDFMVILILPKLVPSEEVDKDFSRNVKRQNKRRKKVFDTLIEHILTNFSI